MHLLQKRRRRIWHFSNSLFLLFTCLPVILGAKFYTGNVSSPSSMKEIFIDDWPDTRKAPLSKNVTVELDGTKKSNTIIGPGGKDKNNGSEPVNSLENIGKVSNIGVS